MNICPCGAAYGVLAGVTAPILINPWADGEIIGTALKTCACWVERLINPIFNSLLTSMSTFTAPSSCTSDLLHLTYAVSLAITISDIIGMAVFGNCLYVEKTDRYVSKRMYFLCASDLCKMRPTLAALCN